MAGGVILYKGPSDLDGLPIVAIATGLKGGITNRKTGGGVVPVWILREDLDPVTASRTGGDASVCGGCIHRGRIEGGKNVDRSCYVTLIQAPSMVWKAYRKGVYPMAANLDTTFLGRGVRIGAYGDPAAVPIGVWHRTLALAAHVSGYTHQWREFPGLARWAMASCESDAERAEAKRLGFRTFRVTLLDSRVDRRTREVVCAASTEAGHKTTCDACRACGGTSSRARADIVITAHGDRQKQAAARRNLARLLDRDEMNRIEGKTAVAASD